MSNPAYSLDNITWVYLPGSYMYGGEPKSIEDNFIHHESDSGVEFNYLLSSKKTFELKFRVGQTGLNAFSTLHAAVNNGGVPFYFSLTGALTDSIYVYKEFGFHPTELGSPGAREPMFDYQLILREAIL